MNGPVVVPLDGSSFAEVAVPMGRVLAEMSGGDLHLVHMMAVPVPGGFHPEEQLTLGEHVRSRSLRYLQEVAGPELSIAGRPPVTVQLEGTKGVARAIAEYASGVDASWVVLTTHGAGGLSRWLTGSVADGLARVATTPLLLLRPWDTTGNLAKGERRFRRILVPLDGSEESEAALAPATELARMFEAPVSLVRVVPPRATSGALHGVRLIAGTAGMEAEAGLYLEDKVEDLRLLGVGAEAGPVAHTNPADGILTAAVERGADAIVLSTHGRGGFERLVLGSVASEVLREARVPLVLVHPVVVERGIRVEAAQAVVQAHD
jgi:nucleotide-binding universal stress UspA family protein